MEGAEPSLSFSNVVEQRGLQQFGVAVTFVNQLMENIQAVALILKIHRQEEILLRGIQILIEDRKLIWLDPGLQSPNELPDAISGTQAPVNLLKEVSKAGTADDDPIKDSHQRPHYGTKYIYAHIRRDEDD